MTASAQVVGFEGALLKRGFWLYVWEIRTQQEALVYYVGRTGDSSSSNAQSPFNRMGQHLGSNSKSNVLRRRMKALGIEPESCTFHLVAYGPILKEALSREGHRTSRDHIGAMEKALAEAMTTAGYHVMNTVSCRAKLDSEAFASVCAAFRMHFPKVNMAEPMITKSSSSETI
jgi:hypothetical protein